MHPLFVDLLGKAFPHQFITQESKHGLIIVFPAKNPDFGEITIEEEYPGAYIVEVGRFSHGHYDVYDGSEEERVQEAAEEVVDLLTRMFNDEVICYGSHSGGGGFFWKHYHDEEGLDGFDLYVWSGLYRKALI